MLRRPIRGLDIALRLDCLMEPLYTRGLWAQRGLFPSFGLRRDLEGPGEVSG